MRDLVTRGHFRSREKQWWSHPCNRSAIFQNPILQAKFIALCVTEPELLPIEVLHCRNRNFRPLMLLWPWPWPDDLYIRTWLVFPGGMPDVWT